MFVVCCGRNGASERKKITRCSRLWSGLSSWLVIASKLGARLQRCLSLAQVSKQNEKESMQYGVNAYKTINCMETCDSFDLAIGSTKMALEK